MPLETKKILWTVMSVLVVLVVASGIALALAFPRKNNYSAPATVAAVAPARTINPDEYIKNYEDSTKPVTAETMQETSIPEQHESAKAGSEQAQAGDIIIVYGDKPDSAAIAALPAQPGKTSQSQPAKPYTPAPPQSKTQASSAVAKSTAAKPKTVAIDEYWIQAAAFTSRSRADDLQRELAQKGLSTIILVKDLDDVTWYRVRIGPYKNDKDAKSWLEKIKLIAACQEAYVSRQTVTGTN